MKKRAVPSRTRVAIAERYGATPGIKREVPCHYCGRPGSIYWFPRRDGSGSMRVVFGHELDHMVPENEGGSSDPENITLACRPCNRSKGTKSAPGAWAIARLPSNFNCRNTGSPTAGHGIPLSRHVISTESPWRRQVLEFEGLTEEELEGANVSGSVSPSVDWPSTIAEAEARGFQSAIEALRDEAAYREWAQSVRIDAGYWPLGWENAAAYLAATRSARPRTEACTSQCKAARLMRERDEARAEVKVLEGALDGSRIATHNMQRLMEDALIKQWAAKADQEDQ